MGSHIVNPRCPPGQIPIDRKDYRRKATTRKGYTRKDGTRVPPTKVAGGQVARSEFCVPDRGSPGVRSFGAESGLRKGTKPLIGKEGKLGGPGYTTKSAATRHEILDKCVKRYGYRSCLGRLQVLLLSSQLRGEKRRAVEEDKRWLMGKYGGPGSFGPRRNPHEEAESEGEIIVCLCELYEFDEKELDNPRHKKGRRRNAIVNPF